MAAVATGVDARILNHSIKFILPLGVLLSIDVIVTYAVHGFFIAVHEVVLGTKVILKQFLFPSACLHDPGRRHLAVLLVVGPRVGRDDVGDAGAMK